MTEQELLDQLGLSLDAASATELRAPTDAVAHGYALPIEEVYPETGLPAGRLEAIAEDPVSIPGDDQGNNALRLVFSAVERHVALVDGVQEVHGGEGAFARLGEAAPLRRTLAIDTRREGWVLLTAESGPHSVRVSADGKVTLTPVRPAAQSTDDEQKDESLLVTQAPDWQTVVGDWPCSPWVTERAAELSEGGGELGRVAALGFLARLSGAEVSDPAAALERRLQGAASPADRVRGWAASLPAEDAEALFSVVLNGAEDLRETVSTFLEREPEARGSLAAGVCAAREQLECLVFVARQSLKDDELLAALEESLEGLDAEVLTQSDALVDALAGQAGQERPRWVRAVRWQEREHWWGRS